MWHGNRHARVNVKLLIILSVVLAGSVLLLVIARQTRRGLLSTRALAAGEAAWESQDWPTAIKSYREYLGRHPDDVGIMRKYAEACLAIRPLSGAAVAAAISAYRRVVQLDPRDEAACERLATLYSATGNPEELTALARARLVQDPHDRKAPLWLAEALLRLNRTAEARQVLQTFLDRLAAGPGQHAEFVRACVQMSQLVASEASAAPAPATPGEDTAEPPTPLDWLNRAVEYAPDSVEALGCRAQFRRQMAEIPGTSKEDREALLAQSRQDLEAADARGAEDPRNRLYLGTEWLAHGELARAAAELQAVDKLPPERLKESFLDISDWTVARFLLAAELVTRQGAAAEAATLAEGTLKSLTEKRHRVRVLPSAISLYVTTGRVSEARRCLDEYLALLRGLGTSADSPALAAWLQALVAKAENRPYAVIDALEPVAGKNASGPGVWRLLAEAYDRTGQAGRAAQALRQYCRFNTQDARALQELARQYSKLGDWKGALEAATAAEALGATDVALRLLRLGAAVNLAVGPRDGERAEELRKLSAELAELRRTHADQVDIRVLQAILADSCGRAEEAEGELKLAAQQCAEPLRAEMQLARHYLKAKRMEDAVRVSETACQRHGEVAEPWLFLADLHAAQANYDAARQCLTQGLGHATKKSERRSLSIKLAVLELAHGDRAAGIHLLRELAAQDQQEIEARSLLVGTREVRADPTAAAKLIDELRQAEGESGLWWRVHQASLWLSADDWSAKQQDITSLLRYCIDADPMWSAPVLLLAGMYEKLGDVRRVEDTYRQGLLGNPAAAEVAGPLLALLERQGRFADAEKVLQQVEVNPQLANAWQVRMALGAKDYSHAIDELKLRVAADDQDALARVQLARLVYQETKDANQALEYLQQAEAQAAGTKIAAVRAFILKGEGKTAEALRVIDAYVAAHDDFDAYALRAAYLAQEGQWDRAEQDYRKLTSLAQGGALGYTPMAVKLAREALQQDPNHREALGVMVDAALGSRERTVLEEIRTRLDAAAARAPTDEKVLLARAEVHAALATPQTAIPSLEAYCRTEKGSGSPAVLVMLADLYRLAGDAERAGQMIEQAQRLDPSDQAVIHARFTWLVSQRRFAELAHISSAYLSARAQDPGLLLRAASTLLSLDAMDLKKEGLKLFQHLATLAPTLSGPRLGLASALYQTGDIEGAKTVYRQLLEQHPDEVRALNDLAWILQEHDQQYAEALELANKGLRLSPGHLHLLDTRGTILSKMPDQLVGARRDFEELVALLSSDAPQRAKALLQLGRVCARLDDLPQARQHLQAALKIDQKAGLFTAEERSEIRRIIEPNGV